MRAERGKSARFSSLLLRAAENKKRYEDRRCQLSHTSAVCVFCLLSAPSKWHAATQEERRGGKMGSKIASTEEKKTKQEPPFRLGFPQQKNSKAKCCCSLVSPFLCYDARTRTRRQRHEPVHSAPVESRKHKTLSTKDFGGEFSCWVFVSFVLFFLVWQRFGSSRQSHTHGQHML